MKGFTETRPFDINDWRLVFTYLGLKLLIIFIEQNVYFFNIILFNRSKIMINGLLLEKMGKVSPYSQVLSEGNLCNLFQIDAMKIAELTLNITHMITLPFSLIISIYSLMDHEFVSGCVILAATIIQLVCNFYNALQFGRISAELLKERDKRMKITNDTFGDVKNLKLLEWDDEFSKRV